MHSDVFSNFAADGSAKNVAHCVSASDSEDDATHASPKAPCSVDGSVDPCKATTSGWS
jgi:hypothetical protein